jgi:hypothetical protein
MHQLLIACKLRATKKGKEITEVHWCKQTIPAASGRDGLFFWCLGPESNRHGT